MRFLELIAALAILINSIQARPEAGYSYNPPVPSGTYNTPISSGNYHPTSLDISAGGNANGLGINGISGGISGGISAGLSSGQNILQGLGGSHDVVSGGFGGLGVSGLGVTGAGVNLGGLSSSSINSGAFSLSGGIGSGDTIVQKHIYVHVPPAEPEELRPQRPIQVPPAQKHYKIIFIKAPTSPTPTAPVIPIQPQNEEKTLVYVLVKKPDEQPQITIPTAVPTQPSKPEVYFIRYKTQKEGKVSLSGSSVSSGSAIESGVSLDTSLGSAHLGTGTLTGSSLLDSSISTGASLDANLSGGHGHGSSISITGGAGHHSSINSGSLSSSYGPPGKIDSY